MNEAVLGAKASPASGVIDQIVVTSTALPLASTQRKAAPPQSCTSMPRCRRYHACIRSGVFCLEEDAANAGNAPHTCTSQAVTVRASTLLEPSGVTAVVR